MREVIVFFFLKKVREFNVKDINTRKKETYDVFQNQLYVYSEKIIPHSIICGFILYNRVKRLSLIYGRRLN